jgi:hypothetical protein
MGNAWPHRVASAMFVGEIEKSFIGFDAGETCYRQHKYLCKQFVSRSSALSRLVDRRPGVASGDVIPLLGDFRLV